MTDGVDTGEHGQEEAAGLVVGDVLVKGQDTVEPGSPEESDQLATHQEDETGQTGVDGLARDSGQDEKVVPASSITGAGVYTSYQSRSNISL